MIRPVDMRLIARTLSGRWKQTLREALTLVFGVANADLNLPLVFASAALVLP